MLDQWGVTANRHPHPMAGRESVRPTRAIVRTEWRHFAACSKLRPSTAYGSTITTRTPIGSKQNPTCRTPASASAAWRSSKRKRLSFFRPGQPRNAPHGCCAVETDAWVRWRCGVFTDWVREFRAILDRERPGALLGTFHCPWSLSDFNGAIEKKLAIDLKSQAKYLDVFSIMPYHARFGHASDPAWISRQTESLGRLLGITGEAGERLKIWPIVQLSDWGERVPASQVREILHHGTRPPATGLTVFVWGTLHPQWDKVEEMRRVYRSLAERDPK